VQQLPKGKRAKKQGKYPFICMYYHYSLCFRADRRDRRGPKVLTAHRRGSKGHNQWSK
jgi:hypothetical protein